MINNGMEVRRIKIQIFRKKSNKISIYSKKKNIRTSNTICFFLNICDIEIINHFVVELREGCSRLGFFNYRI